MNIEVFDADVFRLSGWIDGKCHRAQSNRVLSHRLIGEDIVGEMGERERKPNRPV